MSGAIDVARTRLAVDLAGRGRPYAAFAATVLVCRGRLLLDPTGFARLLGVQVGHLGLLESGWAPPDRAPRRLADLAPDLGWAEVGLDPAAGDDRARRHPADGQAVGRRGENHPP